MPVHSEKQAQVRAILFDKAFTKVPLEYSDYSNIFSVKNVIELLKNIGINEHAIKPEENKQSLFDLIYSLRPVELKILKPILKLIWLTALFSLLNLLLEHLFFFNRKSNKSLCFCVNYRDLNNITIKN